MTSQPDNLSGNSFSFQRVKALMRLMWPRIRNTFLVYLAVGIATMIPILLLMRLSYFLTLLPFAVFIPAILYYISPVFATSTMTASQATLLPATPGEKLLAVGLYSIVILPAAVYLLPQIASYISLFHADAFCRLHIPLQSFYVKNHFWLVMNYLSGCLPLFVCLYSALSNPGKKWRPALMGLLTVLIIGLIGGFYGGIKAFRIGVSAATSKIQSGMISEQEISAQIMDDILGFLPVIIVVCILLCAWFLRLCYRRIASRQI